MPEGQDKVLEAFEALQKALEEEQERLNDPAVTELFRMLGNDRLRLLEWLLSEVQKLAAVWREGKVVVQSKPIRTRRMGERLPKGQEPATKFLSPADFESALAEMGGQGRAKEVLERVFEMAEPHLGPEDRSFLKTSNEFRWRRKANWERYLMVRDGLLRPDSPQGIWELTEAGWMEAKKLIAGETQEQ
jgi:restriction system protein